MLLPRRLDRRVPGREPRADVDAAAAQAEKILRSRHRGRDRAAGPDPGRHGASLSAPAAGHRAGLLSLEGAGGGARQDARRAAVPGTGDEDRHRRRRVSRPAEADKLRRAMATFKRTGTIGTFRDKMINGMLAKGYPRDFAERCFSQIEGFGEYGFPGKPCGELRAAGLCLGLAQMPLSRRVRGGAAQRAADGFLRAGADRARRARARRRGAPGRRQSFRLGRDAGRRPARGGATARAPPRHGGRYPRDACDAARLSQDQGTERGPCGADRRAPRARLRLRARPVAAHRALRRACIERLADADAFGSLGLTRRQALWAAKALGRVGDKDDDLPLFRVAPPACVSRVPRGSRDVSRTLPTPSPQAGR